LVFEFPFKEFGVDSRGTVCGGNCFVRLLKRTINETNAALALKEKNELTFPEQKIYG
jgi:hypothetical protein